MKRKQHFIAIIMVIVFVRKPQNILLDACLEGRGGSSYPQSPFTSPDESTEALCADKNGEETKRLSSSLVVCF